MNILFTEEAWTDYIFWQKNDRNILKKINELVKAIVRDPYDGIGKPEPLKHQLHGYWSRRIDLEHRLVYRIEKSELNIISCRYCFSYS
ncbi:MAG: Txe/YoeB family addiction module toxin [Leptospirales bacterium]